jgi:hypothetical protein
MLLSALILSWRSLIAILRAASSSSVWRRTRISFSASTSFLSLPNSSWNWVPPRLLLFSPSMISLNSFSTPFSSAIFSAARRDWARALSSGLSLFSHFWARRNTCSAKFL